MEQREKELEAFLIELLDCGSFDIDYLLDLYCFGNRLHISLRDVLGYVSEMGYSIGNLDVNVLILGYMELIKYRVADALETLGYSDLAEGIRRLQGYVNYRDSTFNDVILDMAVRRCATLDELLGEYISSLARR